MSTLCTYPSPNKHPHFTMRIIYSTVFLILTLLIAACSDNSVWYAEVTEWVTGLPMDNTCELTAPGWLEPAEQHTVAKNTPHKHINAAFDHSPMALKCTQRPVLPMVPKGKAYLLSYHTPKKVTSSDILALPKGTRVELLSVWLEKMNRTFGSNEPYYAICAELRAEESDTTFWAVLAWNQAPTTLPLLANPTTGTPLSLSLEDALRYARKRSFTHP